MPFDPSPLGFFGPGYELDASAIKFTTVDAPDVTIGTFTADGTTAILTVDPAHNLKVGDKVSISSATTLPAPLTAVDHFVVSVPSPTTLLLSLTKGGAAIVTTDDGTGVHTIKGLGILPEVTDDEANAMTGDWRKVLFGLCEGAYQKNLNTPVADRPARVSIARTTTSNESLGFLTRTYTLRFTTEPLSIDVADE